MLIRQIGCVSRPTHIFIGLQNSTVPAVPRVLPRCLNHSFTTLHEASASSETPFLDGSPPPFHTGTRPGSASKPTKAAKKAKKEKRNARIAAAPPKPKANKVTEAKKLKELKQHASKGHDFWQPEAVLASVTGRPASIPANPKSKRKQVASQTERQVERGSVEDLSVKYDSLDVERESVPGLAYGLDRVLFNPGVYHLQDPRSLVYNFDPYLGSIMPVKEFDFSALNEYITSSKDQFLWDIAKKNSKKYIGSSSSMTAVLSHFHYLLSNWRPISTGNLSQAFPDPLRSFTKLSRAPASVFLRYKDGVYAIDADKEHDTANILMNLGKSMEKLLTTPKEEFEKYRRSSREKIDPETIPSEAYHYSTCGDFLMRAQLDAHDPRLPGSGMFDLKTRAVVSIRMDAKNYEDGLGYQIKGRFGAFESFEREFFDMIRSAFLKYSLQVRIGRMDGIFVAFHNIRRIFGFQYFSLPELDQTLHGQYDTVLGDKEFRLSLGLWNIVLEKATKKFPNRSLRFLFETRDAKTPFMYIFAEPVSEQEIDDIQSRNKAEIEALQKKLLSPDEGEVEAVFAERASAEARADELDTIERIGDREQEGVESATEATEMGADAAESGTINVDGPGAEPNVASTGLTNTPAPTGTAPREIFAACLSTRNRVNDKYVERPFNLRPQHRWEVEYDIRPFIDQQRAQRFYAASKRRRERELAKDDKEGPNSFGMSYLNMLRKLSKEGSAYRAGLDKLERELGVVTLYDR